MKTSLSIVLRRRDILASLAAVATLPFATTVRAQANWPDRPIKLLVPFAAGGNIDLQGRLMAARLSEVIGQQMVVENRVGGNGIIACEQVARAAPDGYTLLWASTSVIEIVPAAAAKISYDPIKDFVPISAMGAGPQVLLVNAKVPAKNLAEFVAYAKAQPKPLAYGGGGGPASASNLIMQLFLKRAGFTMDNVSYRGTSQALTDVIAGHIPAMFIPVAEASAQASNASIRMIAVSGKARSKQLPDLPTVAETYPGFNAVSWTGMMGPAALPKPIVDKLAGEMIKAGRDPKFVEQLIANGVEPIAEGPEKFAEMIAAEKPLWADAVKSAGVQL